jgi:PhnB protein
VSCGLDDPVEGERIFNALAEGGTVTMPFEQTFWALRFGMCIDRFGIPWMIDVEEPQPA